MAQDMAGMGAALKDQILRRHAQQGIAQSMGRPSGDMAAYEQAMMQKRATQSQPGVEMRANPQIEQLQRGMELARQQASLAQFAPSLASPVQAPGARAVQPLDMREAVMAQKQAMEQQRMQQERGAQQEQAVMQREQMMRQQQMAGQMAQLGTRAPLLHRDMMRKQMGAQMAQGQPQGARAALINAKRGMAQGGQGGRAQGGMKSAMNLLSLRQAQGRT